MDLEQIYSQGIKATLEDQELGSKRRQRWEERFQWFVALALFVLMLEPLISIRNRRRAGPPGSVTTVLLIGFMARRELRNVTQKTELLTAVSQGTNDAVFVKDREGRYLLANEAAESAPVEPGRDQRRLHGTLSTQLSTDWPGNNSLPANGNAKHFSKPANAKETAVICF